ncbi:MAG: hypothetical protein MZV65_47975 [Chromatiales bacterium]|nr:hypothetical protein [Chromatiales bacterium]
MKKILGIIFHPVLLGRHRPARAVGRDLVRSARCSPSPTWRPLDPEWARIALHRRSSSLVYVGTQAVERVQGEDASTPR